MAGQRIDQSILDEVAGGSSEAFGRLYERHREYVWRVAIRMTGDESLALDVAQEAFAWLLGRCRKRRLVLTAELTTYLYPVIRNIAATRRRKQVREIVGEVPEVESRDPAARTDLARVLAGLPEHQREVLLLRFVDDLSLLEIAALLEIPTGTVKSRLHKALQRLRADPGTRDLLC